MFRSYCLQLICIGIAATLLGCHDSASTDLTDIVSDSDRVAAVTKTIKDSTDCTTLGDFYWEIGDRLVVRGSGQVGNAFTASTSMAIASATDWVFGAYVLEKENGALTASDISDLTMNSGYHSLDPALCSGAVITVQGCFDAGTNNTNTAGDVNKFYYDGGHSQKLAIALGLGSLNAAQLTAELKTKLGADLSFSFGGADTASGLVSTATQYAVFLRKILAGTLKMRSNLATQKVCTLPASCTTAVDSPAPLAWHYGYNHWVEDDATGDGSFSSAGEFGFYPWIDSVKATYGIIARHDLTVGSGFASAVCGKQMRNAWNTGVAL